MLNTISSPSFINSYKQNQEKKTGNPSLRSAINNVYQSQARKDFLQRQHDHSQRKNQRKNQSLLVSESLNKFQSTLRELSPEIIKRPQKKPQLNHIKSQRDSDTPLANSEKQLQSNLRTGKTTAKNTKQLQKAPQKKLTPPNKKNIEPKLPKQTKSPKLPKQTKSPLSDKNSAKSNLYYSQLSTIPEVLEPIKHNQKETTTQQTVFLKATPQIKFVTCREHTPSINSNKPINFTSTLNFNVQQHNSTNKEILQTKETNTNKNKLKLEEINKINDLIKYLPTLTHCNTNEEKIKVQQPKSINNISRTKTPKGYQVKEKNNLLDNDNKNHKIH